MTQLLVNLGLKASDVDSHKQTSIFYAAREGNAQLLLGTMWSGLVRFV